MTHEAFLAIVSGFSPGLFSHTDNPRYISYRNMTDVIQHPYTHYFILLLYWHYAAAAADDVLHIC